MTLFEKLFMLLKFVYKTQPGFKVPLCPSVLKPLDQSSEIAVMERNPSTSRNMCFQDVKEYASTLFSFLHSKVALHTSQKRSLHRSGNYFRDWASQNSLALPCVENLIISSLYKMLKSLHKCTCCSQLPQKNL